MNLSKSLYTKGIQCPKALWLKKYKPSVLTPPDEQAQAIFETGNIVGDLACQLFPDGKEVLYTTNYDEMLSTTQKWLGEGVQNIYEATFNYDGILIMVDILKVEDDGVSIYEVKSSTEVKDIYLHDVSIQYYVLENLGFNIKSASVVHINNEYVRGESLELDKLFKIVDVTSVVQNLQPNIPSILKEFETYLADKDNEPRIDIGKHCNKPYECDAKDYCWRVQRQIPEYSIFNIFNLGSKKQVELYNQGIIDIEDIPKDFAMTPNQKQAVQNYRSKQTYIDKDKIGEFLKTLAYPIYHLDFETYQQAIAEYEVLKPFEQIPFQYSLHIEHQDGTLEHKEFLAKQGSDPREEIAKHLVQDIPVDVTVLTYNMYFEKGVIQKLSNRFSHYSQHLEAINENIKDLMVPFQKKWYQSPKLQGSYSIKYVLPALVPEFKNAYKELDAVQNGAQAMQAFATLDKLTQEQQQKVRSSLLAYCRLDTLAMVKILQKLKQIVV